MKNILMALAVLAAPAAFAADLDNEAAVIARAQTKNQAPKSVIVRVRKDGKGAPQVVLAEAKASRTAAEIRTVETLPFAAVGSTSSGVTSTASWGYVYNHPAYRQHYNWHGSYNNQNYGSYNNGSQYGSYNNGNYNNGGYIPWRRWGYNAPVRQNWNTQSYPWYFPSYNYQNQPYYYRPINGYSSGEYYYAECEQADSGFDYDRAYSRRRWGYSSWWN